MLNIVKPFQSTVQPFTKVTIKCKAHAIYLFFVITKGYQYIFNILYYFISIRQYYIIISLSHYLQSFCVFPLPSHCLWYNANGIITIQHALLKTIVSSATSRTLDCNLAGRSFIYTKNSIGPITDPWGTLLVTGTHEDIFPLHTILCCRRCKKLSIHWLMELLIPYSLSLRINYLWGTLPKAFAKSITITYVCLCRGGFCGDLGQM